MAQPYVGEIRLFAGNFPPAGWLYCDGQLLPISGNETLFQLIGTTYGGDGWETFALPNMQSRVPLHMGASSFGNTYQLGEMAGTESETLTVQQIPSHTHAPLAQHGSGNRQSPSGSVFAASPLLHGTSTADAAMHAQAVASAGGSQPHNNMAPFLGISYIISLYGIFPSPT